MSRSRFAVLLTCLSFLAGSAGSAMTQLASRYLGAKVHAGIDSAVNTAAQVQIVGADGGLALVARDPRGENFLMGTNRVSSAGNDIKSFSLSTIVGRASDSDGFFITRLNTTHLVDGKQLDAIPVMFCGGKGVVFNPSEPWSAGECPGPGVVAFKGKILINGRMIE